MTIIPVIYLEDSPLSSTLRDLLKNISSETGRIIFFLDLNKIAIENSRGIHLVKARVSSEPDKPYIAIQVNINQISKSLYNPKIHDPLIAHEAYHPLLWSRGYLPLVEVSHSDDQSYWIHLINNWIADPIINAEIYKLGFDISVDKTHELKSSIKPLNKGIWASKPFIESFQLAVAFLLEPNISRFVRSEFEMAIKRGLGIPFYQKVDFLVKEIKSLDFSTAENYRQSVMKVVEILSSKFQLNFPPLNFSAPFIKFSEDEVRAWKIQEIVETEAWQ